MAENLIEKKQTLGEILSGDRLVSSPFNLNFLVDRDSEILCRKNLTKEEVSQFRTAIALDYYLQMYYDDLPIWAFIGRIDIEGKSIRDEYKYFLFTQLVFEIYFNGNQVVEINVRTQPSKVVELTMGKVFVEFSYTVKWKEATVSFEKRMDKYLMSAFLPHHLSIHQSAITNSFSVMVILIGCLVGLYVCVLRRDFNKDEGDEELADNQEMTGWKILHGDVFRFPNYKNYLAAAIGSGVQLFAVVAFILVLGFLGVFHPYDRGFIKTAIVISYAIACGLAGFTSVSFYCQLEGSEWVRNLCLTGCLFIFPLFLMFCVLNTIATVYGATIALPLSKISVILLLWMCLAVPLLSLGGILGKMMDPKFQAPCKTSKIPREIPRLRWYRGVLPQMTLAGLLPFSVIFIELYYIFASIWGHRIYMLYGVLCAVFILLVIITSLVSGGLTYFQLAAEDHRWWWRSFLCGGSTGLYVYVYCIFYYFQRSDMSGLMQISFFFGYMACICFGIFLMLGTVGFIASLIFVWHIYDNIKSD